MCKVAVVTGGKRGIGLAIGKRFASEGIKVILADILDASQEAESICREGGSAIAVLADVRNEDDVNQLFQTAMSGFGPVKILVNNAAVFEPGVASEESVEKWNWIVDTNLKGPFLCSRAAVRQMETTGGVIINIGSEYGIKGGPRRAIYAAAKGGLNQLTRCLAVDYAKQGIRVNCVCPGPILTPLLQRVIDDAEDPALMTAAEVGSTVIKRFGTLDEIAAVVSFIASDEASFITGAIISADGGVTSI